MLKRKIILSVSFFFCSIIMLAKSKECRTDFNKNGKKDVFEDSKQPVEKRIANLLFQMTLDEKTCQLATLYGHGLY